MDCNHDKKVKETVRKRGSSALRKAISLGRDANVFSLHIHWNPTCGALDGAIHLPEGQKLPDLNQFVRQSSPQSTTLAKTAQALDLLKSDGSQIQRRSTRRSRRIQQQGARKSPEPSDADIFNDILRSGGSRNILQNELWTDYGTTGTEYIGRAGDGELSTIQREAHDDSFSCQNELVSQELGIINHAHAVETEGSGEVIEPFDGHFYRWEDYSFAEASLADCFTEQFGGVDHMTADIEPIAIADAGALGSEDYPLGMVVTAAQQPIPDNRWPRESRNLRIFRIAAREMRKEGY